MTDVRSLVIAPLHAEGQGVLDAVGRGLDELGIHVFRLDDITAGASWANAVTDAIRHSDFIVADVSGEEANVLYELGFAHALRKPAILIVSSDHKLLPSDLAGFQYIVYDPNNLGRLVEEVKKSARSLAVRAGSE